MINDKFDNGKIINVKKFKISYKRIDLNKLIIMTHRNITKQAKDFIDLVRGGRLKIKSNLKWKRKAYSREEFENARKIKLTDTKSNVLKKIKAFTYKDYESVYINFKGLKFEFKNIKTIIIAEAGVNHNGNIVLAKKLIDVASKAGADYVKFQTFNVDDLVLKKTKTANYQKKFKKNISQYSMLKKYQLNDRDHKELIKYSKKKN